MKVLWTVVLLLEEKLMVWKGMAATLLTEAEQESITVPSDHED